ncbi:putative RNA binding protein [Leptomonas pyrrhocoris]|uniref:Putative RNA binding protein n=1 Tax=Leptomonas pyrrhocoris TaxID=157538 RepID=A0A0N0VG63_LEPPY|nr:putative RNA binding protein [Leptomonas pyrrhocoris]XP_015661340.1 putative RNA binding protein [Leptomonas pyrrhocoris]KPA82900.1 putative RNA binding protein [Leptomonas pyrrhocoris]KPA82901.1 putative RNA binding protein [Leptomonas pyrrhocoris]|eukprot:XP_015661339.1 putative RNA binding protein [Leptomonas pyrrhocoris]
MADENVPPGITEKQDEIIQYVAKYVVNSCDGARYQEKIRTRTKYNSYFAFLDAKHPYHHYYQYLLDSYRYYLLNSAAVNAGGWGDGGEAAPQQQQQQFTEEEYYQYYGAYQGQTGGIGFQTGEEEVASGSYSTSNAQETSLRPPRQDDVSAAPNSGYATASATGGASAVGNAASAVGGQGEANATGAAPVSTGEAGAEEDEEEYELVMENGEWVSRKRS